MDLADRGRRERLVAERPEDRLRIVPELLADDRADLVVRERRDLVQQLEQLVAVGGRQQVEAQREHLAELDPGAAEPLEGEPHPDRPAAPVGAGQVERRRDEEQEEDDEDVPDPARVPEQRSHVASTRSAGDGRRRPVPSRDSSATGCPGAELAPSRALVVHRDAAATGREGGLLLPLATGPDELREASAARSDRGAPSRLPAASWRLASVADAHADGVRDPRLALVEGRREPAVPEMLRVLGALLVGRAVQPRLAPLSSRGPPRRRSRPASARGAAASPLGGRAGGLARHVRHVDHPRSRLSRMSDSSERRVYLAERGGEPRETTRPSYPPDRSNQVVLSWV